MEENIVSNNLYYNTNYSNIKNIEYKNLTMLITILTIFGIIIFLQLVILIIYSWQNIVIWSKKI